MSEERNKRVFERVIEEAYSKGNVDVLDETFATNFVEHQAGIVPPTADGVKRSIAFLRDAFPDLKLTIEEILASGDKTWARITARGTHQGTFMEILPTDKSVVVTVMDECRFENGKIVEHWGSPDRFAILSQLDLLPKL